MTKLDTAVITKGTFTFEGTQDSVVSRYVTCEVNGEPLMIDFFLENGNITVALGEENKIGGTANNDTYQQFKDNFPLTRIKSAGDRLRKQRVHGLVFRRQDR